MFSWALYCFLKVFLMLNRVRSSLQFSVRQRPNIILVLQETSPGILPGVILSTSRHLMYLVCCYLHNNKPWQLLLQKNMISKVCCLIHLLSYPPFPHTYSFINHRGNTEITTSLLVVLGLFFVSPTAPGVILGHGKDTHAHLPAAPHVPREGPEVLLSCPGGSNTTRCPTVAAGQRGRWPKPLTGQEAVWLKERYEMVTTALTWAFPKKAAFIRTQQEQGRLVGCCLGALWDVHHFFPRRQWMVGVLSFRLLLLSVVGDG